MTKLFGMTLADRGYFGQKDWQQLQVVLAKPAATTLYIWWDYGDRRLSFLICFFRPR